MSNTSSRSQCCMAPKPRLTAKAALNPSNTVRSISLAPLTCCLSAVQCHVWVRSGVVTSSGRCGSSMMLTIFCAGWRNCTHSGASPTSWVSAKLHHQPASASQMLHAETRSFSPHHVQAVMLSYCRSLHQLGLRLRKRHRSSAAQGVRLKCKDRHTVNALYSGKCAEALGVLDVQDATLSFCVRAAKCEYASCAPDVQNRAIG